MSAPRYKHVYFNNSYDSALFYWYVRQNATAVGEQTCLLILIPRADEFVYFVSLKSWLDMMNAFNFCCCGHLAKQKLNILK